MGPGGLLKDILESKIGKKITIFPSYNDGYGGIFREVKELAWNRVEWKLVRQTSLRNVYSMMMMLIAVYGIYKSL